MPIRVGRVVVLALGQLTPLASDFWLFAPGKVRPVVVASALGLILVVARVVWPRVASERSSRF